MKDVWVIRDHFLLEVYGELSRMKSDAIMTKRAPPYLHKMYNVQFFTANPLSEVKNIMTRLVNSLVKALNDAKYLPRIILVVLDDDILHQIGKLKVGTDAIIILEKAINWVMLQMERAITSKKDGLKKKKPGAVVTSKPKVIWVKMLKRYNACNHLMQVRNTYNEVVEKAMVDRTNHYIIDLAEKMGAPTYFNKTAPFDLTGDGRMRYWKEIDFAIEQFDFQRLSLKPRRYLTEINEDDHKSEVSANKRRKFIHPQPWKRTWISKKNNPANFNAQ